MGASYQWRTLQALTWLQAALKWLQVALKWLQIVPVREVGHFEEVFEVSLLCHVANKTCGQEENLA